MTTKQILNWYCDHEAISCYAGKPCPKPCKHYKELETMLHELTNPDDLVKTITVGLMCTGRNPMEANQIAKLVVELLGEES